MGKKGARETPAAVKAADSLVARLDALGGVTAKRMFGGVGIFCEGSMFALVNANGQPFLKANATTRAEFEAAGSERHGKMPYWRIPEDVLSSSERLLSWAKAAVTGLEE